MNRKSSEAEIKIPDTSSLVTTTVLNTKIGEVEKKILDYARYIINQEFNKLTTKKIAERLEQANLVNKSDFDIIN